MQNPAGDPSMTQLGAVCDPGPDSEAAGMTYPITIANCKIKP